MSNNNTSNPTEYPTSNPKGYHTSKPTGIINLSSKLEANNNLDTQYIIVIILSLLVLFYIIYYLYKLKLKRRNISYYNNVNINPLQNKHVQFAIDEEELLN